MICRQDSRLTGFSRTKKPSFRTLQLWLHEELGLTERELVIFASVGLKGSGPGIGANGDHGRRGARQVRRMLVPILNVRVTVTVVRQPSRQIQRPQNSPPFESARPNVTSIEFLINVVEQGTRKSSSFFAILWRIVQIFTANKIKMKSMYCLVLVTTPSLTVDMAAACLRLCWRPDEYRFLILNLGGWPGFRIAGRSGWAQKFGSRAGISSIAAVFAFDGEAKQGLLVQRNLQNVVRFSWHFSWMEMRTRRRDCDINQGAISRHIQSHVARVFRPRAVRLLIDVTGWNRNRCWNVKNAQNVLNTQYLGIQWRRFLDQAANQYAN